MSSKASWWAGWCTDHDGELIELAELSGFLLELRNYLDGVPVERMRSAVRLLFPNEMTPTAEHVLTRILDEYSD
jgi:hypothetical protein